jgi:transposase-like protein
MHCPHCGEQDCIQIEIRLKDEDTVQFFSCRHCEAKWWRHDGDTIALDEVLSLTAESEAR